MNPEFAAAVRALKTLDDAYNFCKAGIEAAGPDRELYVNFARRAVFGLSDEPGESSAEEFELQNQFAERLSASGAMRPLHALFRAWKESGIGARKIFMTQMQGKEYEKLPAPPQSEIKRSVAEFLEEQGVQPEAPFPKDRKAAHEAARETIGAALKNGAKWKFPRLCSTVGDETARPLHIEAMTALAGIAVRFWFFRERIESGDDWNRVQAIAAELEPEGSERDRNDLIGKWRTNLKKLITANREAIRARACELEAAEPVKSR